MSPENTSSPTKLCPTCGTRLSSEATRCLVCGADLGTPDKPVEPAKSLQGSRIPEITLSLPVAILVMAVFLVIGAVMVYFAIKSTPKVQALVVPPTDTPTITVTMTPSTTPTPETPTLTFTPLPTPTSIFYTVKSGDNCGTIAGLFNISIQSIVTTNNLSATCDLRLNQQLLIPQPTPTPSPMPTSTLGAVDQTRAACQMLEYVVKDTDTLGGIALNYNISQAVIRDENGLTGDSVYIGQKLTLPLCKRNATPGPTSSPTPPPPYLAPNLLLPADGTSFSQGVDTITLQWASIGTLRDNESYAVSVVDATAGTGLPTVNYVNDTKFIVPPNLRPTDIISHAFYWWVTTVRQTGTDDSGNPLWTSAGVESQHRVFIWSSAAPALVTPTP